MINWLLAIGLIVLILFVVITGSILHKRQRELDDINNKNDIVKPSEQKIANKTQQDKISYYLFDYIN